MLLLANTYENKVVNAIFSTKAIYYTYKQHIFDKQNIKPTLLHIHSINLLKPACKLLSRLYCLDGTLYIKLQYRLDNFQV